MTALLLGWSHRRPGQLQHAVMAAAASLQAVLQATTAAAGPAALQTERTAEVPSAAAKPLLPFNLFMPIEPCDMGCRLPHDGCGCVCVD